MLFSLTSFDLCRLSHYWMASWTSVYFDLHYIKNLKQSFDTKSYSKHSDGGCWEGCWVILQKLCVIICAY